MDQAVRGQTICEAGDQRRLFTDLETLVLSVGEMDLATQRSRRGHVLNRYVERPRNALADRRLEALRALVVNVGVAKNDAMLEAACIEALGSGLSETQIAFIVARHRVGHGKSKQRGRRGGERPGAFVARRR